MRWQRAKSRDWPYHGETYWRNGDNKVAKRQEILVARSKVLKTQQEKGFTKSCEEHEHPLMQPHGTLSVCHLSGPLIQRSLLEVRSA